MLAAVIAIESIVVAALIVGGGNPFDAGEPLESLRDPDRRTHFDPAGHPRSWAVEKNRERSNRRAIWNHNRVLLWRRAERPPSGQGGRPRLNRFKASFQRSATKGA